MEVIRHTLKVIRQLLGERGRFQKRYTGVVLRTSLGQCWYNEEVARRVGGTTWRSKSALAHPDQVFPGHTLMVKDIRPGRAVVADISAPREGRIVGFVNSTSDHAIRRGLARLTKFRGWKKSGDYS